MSIRQRLAPDEPIKTLTFEDAQRRRLCFRNERSLYRRKCDATGEEIISIYSPDKPYKVYKNDYWYSDKWDALDYGRTPNFNKPFFEQLAALQLEVPRLALSNNKNINSEYCNMTLYNKNCYLLFGGDFNEDAMYGVLCMHNKNVAECDYSYNCELCYEIQDCTRCYNTDYAMDCNSCTDCSYVSDCIGCQNCVLCTNLINQSYCIENEKLSKEDFAKKKAELGLGNPENSTSRAELYKRFLDLREKRIVKFAHVISCENCTGDYLKNCKNCQNCFDASGCEDLQDVIFAMNCKDCLDCSLLGNNCQLCYDCISAISSFNIKHSNLTIEGHDIEYCNFTINCSNLFGCVGLHHKHHCILNRQYEPAEFERLRAQLIEHMRKTGEYGQSLPKSMATFGYNESTANAYFPLTREEALAQGYKWKD